MTDDRPLLPFPTDRDYRARLESLQFAMRTEGWNALALRGVDSHRYLGGVDGIAEVRPVWLVVWADGIPGFVSPRVESAEIASQSWIPVAADWIEWFDSDTPRSDIEALARLVTSRPGVQRLGIDYDCVSLRAGTALRERLDLEIGDATELVRDARKTKDAATIDVVRRCADIAVHQFEASRAAAVVGAAEWQVVLAGRTAGVERAAHWWAGEPEHAPLIGGIQCIASGPLRTARAHARGGGRVLADGDQVQLCFCGRPLFGHGIGFDRPIRVGDRALGSDVTEIVDTARAAQEAVLAIIRPGTTTGELHEAAIDTVARRGIPSSPRHRTGRAIGLSDPEWPEIKAGDRTPLRAGMLLAIEPGVYVDGIGGARFGDTVLVTPDGFEALTPLELARPEPLHGSRF